MKTAMKSMLGLSISLFIILFCLSGISHESAAEDTGVKCYCKDFFGLQPDSLLEGFSAADSVRVYGTPEKKQTDGTIFDYINGGGIVYIKHGFVKVSHVLLSNISCDILTYDVFDMGSQENAVSAFNDTNICPEDPVIIDIGEGCKTYLFKPDYLLYFHKSRYLVYIGVDNDSLTPRVVSLARKVALKIP